VLTQPKLLETKVNVTSPRRIRHSCEDRCRCVDLILQGDSPRSDARKCGVARASAYRYKRRFEQGGYAALRELPSIPKSHPRRTPPEVEAQIIELRQTRGWAPRMISNAIGLPHATVSRVLQRAGLSRTPRLPKPEPNRGNSKQEEPSVEGAAR
jgi:transposase